ncbi:MAG: glutamate--tRNA ligase [Nitrospinota bacterium]
MKSVRVRFAPSPTGKPHVGNIRTALFNYLFARKHQGRFIIRIEDSDQSRFDSESESLLFKILNKLGIKADEAPDIGGEFGPYRQSERLSIYQQSILALAKNDHIYRCFCSKEQLQSDREKLLKLKQPPRYLKHCRELSESTIQENLSAKKRFIWRFRTGSSLISFHDQIKGELSFKEKEIGDFPLTREDGSPLYLLCSAVDDMDMKITDVIRGDDHLSNSPKQILIINGLGGELPTYHHLPLIVNNQGAKLSKRDSDSDFSKYLDIGYQKEALNMALLTLGFGKVDASRPITLESAVKIFDIRLIGKSVSKFDTDRLEFLNNQQLRKLDGRPFFELIESFDPEINNLKKERIAKVTAATIKKLDDAAPLIKQFFIRSDLSLDDSNLIKSGALEELLTIFLDELKKVEILDDSNLQAMIDIVRKKSTIAGSKLFTIPRLVLTGGKQGASLKDIIIILGKKIAIERIEKVLKSKL